MEEEKEHPSEEHTREEEEEEENEETKRKQISFPDNLWGSLEAIRDNAKKGTNILEGVINFTKSFKNAYDHYGLALLKALEVFEREMLKYNTLDTTTICMSSFCSEMKNMIGDMTERVGLFDELIHNPSVLFTKHYIEQNKKYIDESKHYISEIDSARKHVEKSKQKYHKRCKLKAESEIEIENKLKDHEDGLITFEQMQDTANRALNIKYKTEVSLQDYKQEVEYLNNLIKDSDVKYKP
jgi:hypothetical protein